ncbi:MAG: metal ABC transporter ATP-binding protein [Clostridia bacterium]|nr:metal ABC transporter ATP-binding protein [Clostridia bacterium]
MPLITVSDLTLGYESKIIIRNLSFKVERGDYLYIVGENGSGKTTLIKTLLKLQPPVSGKIEYEDGLTRKGIGYLPQQSNIQKDFPATVWEIVLSGRQKKRGLRPFYSSEDRKVANECIRRMELESLIKSSYRDLSGGQQQRVLLARALCTEGDLLILDEPVSGLDPVIMEEMYALVESLNRDGITVVMISHDIAAATRYASHIIHIGEKLFFGTRDEYLNSDTSKWSSAK